MNNRILVVEDEARLAALLADYLRQADFAPHILKSGLEAVPWVREHDPALILLDLMLPGRNGMDICKEIRRFSDVPIIMVTARVEEIDRLLGLELGADDYICKPYSMREVVARVKAVLRRPRVWGKSAENALRLDEGSLEIVLNGRRVGLTAVEFQLLRHLVSHPGRIFSRDQLMDRIYPDRRVVADRTVDSHIKNLRKKLGAIAPGEELIFSVYGAGYKFDPPC